MSTGANQVRSLRAAAVACLLAISLAAPALAGVGPDEGSESRLPAAPAPTPAREARPIGPAHPVAATPDTAAHPPSNSGGFLRTSLALCGVIALIVASGAITRAVARSRGGLAGAFGPGGRAPSGVISVLGRYPIARGQKLVLLHLDRRVLLVSQSGGGRLGAGGGMATLCEITDPEEVASILIKSRDSDSESIAERFRTMLGAVDRHFRPHADQPPDLEMRRVFAGESGDRAELWDDRSISPAEPTSTAFPIKQPGPPEHEAVGSLRRRLAALRSEEGSLEAST